MTYGLVDRSSQSLNRYAYCEGNPVSMVDPFGWCGENANDQGKKSKYGWLHTALDVVGLFFDAADIVNAALYAYEKDWTNAAICAASAIPAVGAAVIGVAKSAKAVIAAKKAEKIASLAAEASKMTKNAANTLDAFSDTMKAVSKWGDNPLKLADGIATETASKALKALETGGDFAKESQKAVWEMKAVVGADGIRLSTKADEGASLLKHGMAGTDGVAKSGKGKSIVHLDNNVLVEAIDNGNYARIDTAIAGRIPVVSDTVKNEYLVKGNSKLLNNFLEERGGYFVSDASKSEVKYMIALGQNSSPNRVIHEADAIVAATAKRDNASLMTADKRLTKYLKAFGLKVEGY